MTGYSVGDIVRIARKNDNVLQMFGQCGKVFEIATLDRTSRPIGVYLDDGGACWFKECELQKESDACIAEKDAKASTIANREKPDLIGPRPVGQSGPPPRSCRLL